MIREFVKVEGLGNDFVLFDLRDHPKAVLDREIDDLRRGAQAWCTRRRGIGGDGLLILGPPADPRHDATMIVINADGSRPQMCGNGVRCVALYLRGVLGKDELRIDTDAGLRRCRIESAGNDGAEAWVRVDMGPYEILGERDPVGVGRRFLAISIGNPHAVAFVGQREDPESLARSLGPTVETDGAFPERTNVELVRIEPDRSLLLWVWERGVGITDACGTGACATAAAAVHHGLLAPETDVIVHLPGGDLRIRVPEDRGAGVLMSGPARIVYRGRVGG